MYIHVEWNVCFCIHIEQGSKTDLFLLINVFNVQLYEVLVIQRSLLAFLFFAFAVRMRMKSVILQILTAETPRIQKRFSAK